MKIGICIAAMVLTISAVSFAADTPKEVQESFEKAFALGESALTDSVQFQRDCYATAGKYSSPVYIVNSPTSATCSIEFKDGSFQGNITYISVITPKISASKMTTDAYSLPECKEVYNELLSLFKDENGNMKPGFIKMSDSAIRSTDGRVSIDTGYKKGICEFNFKVIK